MKKEFYKTIEFWVGILLTANLFSLFEDKLMTGSWWWDLIFGLSGVGFLVYTSFIKDYNKTSKKQS